MDDGTEVYINKFGREIKNYNRLYFGSNIFISPGIYTIEQDITIVTNSYEQEQKDMDYFQERLISALKVPKEFLGQEPRIITSLEEFKQTFENS